MNGVTGFDFQHLTRRALTSLQQPVNLAEQYGVNIVPAQGSVVWRCIGVYHLTPNENKSRHNCYVEVLDESGIRTNAPLLKWKVWTDASTQSRRLDKPADEPASDIPIEIKDTLMLWIDDGVHPSDSVGNIHTRHGDEGPERWNSWGHHSFFVVYQLQSGHVVTPPVVEPPTLPVLTLEQRVAELEAWRKATEGK